MRPDATDREPTKRDGALVRRRLKYVLLASYLAWLALVPEWATLGFWSTPMLAQQAELEDQEADRFETVSWDLLGGFSYDLDTRAMLENASPEALAQRNGRVIPAEVRALDRRAIAIRGYVIPIVVTGGRITEFILAAKNEIGCCFGDGLSMNQWIHVAAREGHSFDVAPLSITTVLGVLEVGEEIHEGIVLSLYRMNGATVRSG